MTKTTLVSANERIFEVTIEDWAITNITSLDGEPVNQNDWAAVLMEAGAA